MQIMAIHVRIITAVNWSAMTSDFVVLFLVTLLGAEALIETDEVNQLFSVTDTDVWDNLNPWSVAPPPASITEMIQETSNKNKS